MRTGTLQLLGVAGFGLAIGALRLATDLTPGHPWSVSPTPEGWMAAAWIASGTGMGIAFVSMLVVRSRLDGES